MFLQDRCSTTVSEWSLLERQELLYLYKPVMMHLSVKATRECPPFPYTRVDADGEFAATASSSLPFINPNPGAKLTWKQYSFTVLLQEYVILV